MHPDRKSRNKEQTMIKPSPAHSAAFLARPCDTPNSSKTAVKERSRVMRDSTEITLATVK